MFKWNALRQFVRSSFGSGGVIRRQVRRGMVSAQAVQALEARQLLSSTLNQGWRDISALTVSFAPDGTTVDGNASQLSAKLDALAPRAVWQQTILDAFQSWAQHANLNVGVVADGGQAFGTVGNYQGDARFGDVRIAAAPLGADVAALTVNSVGAISGTWSGDIVLNTSAQLANLDQLYNIFAHESGHVFGMPGSTDSASPMYNHASATGRKAPLASEITYLQNLNGLRGPDRNELVGSNDTAFSATRVDKKVWGSGINAGTAPALEWGEISTASDADFYQVTDFPVAGSYQVELRSVGMSQLRGNLSVFDSAGNQVGQAVAGVGGNENLTVTLNGVATGSTYTVRVSSTGGAATAVGDYVLVVKSVERNAVTDANIDAVARTRYDFMLNRDVRRLLLANGSLLNDDATQGDDEGESEFVDGQRLDTTIGFAANTRYDTIGSLNVGDSDSFRVRTPQTGGQLMLVEVQGLTTGGLLPKVTVQARNGAVVPATVLLNGLGQYVIQTGQLLAGDDYQITVSSALGAAPYSAGNYRLKVEFGSQALAHNQLLSGSVSAAASQQWWKMDVQPSQLMQLALEVGGSSSQAGVEVAIFTADGRLAYRLVSRAGDTRTAASLLLESGIYYVQVSGLAAPGSSLGTLSYRLSGTGVTDPIGPTISDSTSDPSIDSSLPQAPGTTVLPQPPPSTSTGGSTTTTTAPSTDTIYGDYYWSTGLVA